MGTKSVVSLSLMAMLAMAAACDPVETSQHAEVAHAGNLTVGSDDSVRVGDLYVEVSRAEPKPAKHHLFKLCVDNPARLFF